MGNTEMILEGIVVGAKESVKLPHALDKDEPRKGLSEGPHLAPPKPAPCLRNAFAKESSARFAKGYSAFEKHLGIRTNAGKASSVYPEGHDTAQGGRFFHQNRVRELQTTLLAIIHQLNIRSFARI
jgi:hypothetical protein